MDINIAKIKNRTKIFAEKVPVYFERYEIITILAGAIMFFLLAGLVFYLKAYKVTESVPDTEDDAFRVNSELFEKTVKELEQRKTMAPDLPIIDPFN